MNPTLQNKLSELKQICHSFGVKRLFAFGSVLTDKFDKNSDIDLLISFDDSLSVEAYTENYFLLQYKLRSLFNRDIDLITEKSLNNPYFIDNINQTKQLIYEA